MKIKSNIILLLMLLLMVHCSAPQDPVDKFIVFMEKRLAIMEKYKDDPAQAANALAKFNTGKEKEITTLNTELKNLNKGLTEEKNQALLLKLKPLIERMLKLSEESPTLLIDENISAAFDIFDLGL